MGPVSGFLSWAGKRGTHRAAGGWALGAGLGGEGRERQAQGMNLSTLRKILVTLG